MYNRAVGYGSYIYREKLSLYTIIVGTLPLHFTSPMLQCDNESELSCTGTIRGSSLEAFHVK